MKITRKPLYGKPYEMPLDDALYNMLSPERDGAIEVLEERIMNVSALLRKTIAVLVEAKALGPEHIQQILGSDYKVEP